MEVEIRMKLVIQIPCYNEEQNIEQTIKELPTEIEDIDEIEYLIIDDGSIDDTVKIARQNGVKHILEMKANKGLARTFKAGIDASLRLGADIIVNTDGDNQYSGKDIKKLIRPILDNKADLVIGQRQIEKFSFTKKMFQKIGSFMVRKISNTTVKDAPSGFRAYSRKYAMKINVFNDFTYTLETIIQAGKNNIRIENVKIQFNPDTRKSRLFKNIYEYIRKSIANIIKASFIYKPIKNFAIIGTIFNLIGIVLLVVSSYYQELISLKIFIVGIALVVTGIILYALAMRSNLDVANRKLLEDIQYELRKIEYDGERK